MDEKMKNALSEVVKGLEPKAIMDLIKLCSASRENACTVILKLNEAVPDGTDVGDVILALTSMLCIATDGKMVDPTAMAAFLRVIAELLESGDPASVQTLLGEDKLEINVGGEKKVEPSEWN